MLVKSNRPITVFTLGNVRTNPETVLTLASEEPDIRTTQRSQEFYDACSSAFTVVSWACGRFPGNNWSEEAVLAQGERSLLFEQFAAQVTPFSCTLQMGGHPTMHHQKPYFIVVDFMPYLPEERIAQLDIESFPNLAKDVLDPFSYVYQEATGVICYTPLSRHAAIQDCKLNPQKVTVICSGVCGHVDPDFEKRPEKLILWVGSNFQVKGGEETVAAFELLYHDDPSWRLVMVGTDYKSGHPGITTYPFLHGDDLKVLDDLYRRARVFILPSHKENLGLVYLEAMARKTPVITTTRGGIAEIIRRIEAGKVVRPYHPEEIVEAVRTICQSDVSYQKYADAAWRFSDQNTRWETAAARIQDAVERGLKGLPLPEDYNVYT